MSKLLEFFKAKKLERKFSRLGDGHRLDDPSPRPVPPKVEAKPSRSVDDATASASKAAEAALDRLKQNNKKPDRPVEKMVRKELEEARRAEQEAEKIRERFTQKVVVHEKLGALSRVLFWCPALFGQSLVGPREEIEEAINKYLMDESIANPAEAASLILIRGLYNSKPPVMPDVSLVEQPTVSEWREKRKQNFIRILSNLIQSPENQTYRRLRASNRLVQDLLSIDGSDLFFRACGFVQQIIPTVTPVVVGEDRPSCSETTDTETFLVISEDDARAADHLQKMLDLLDTAEPILPELFRDTKVFQISNQTPMLPSRDQLPDDFFYLTKEELKRSLEQQQRIVEESGMLMTKAMRERLRMQEVRMYRYALIRIRLPDQFILQGTFYATDNLSTIRSWISECLSVPSIEYQLWAPPGTIPATRTNAPPTVRAELTNNTATLTELGLAPCSLINLSIVSTTVASTGLLRADLLNDATAL